MDKAVDYELLIKMFCASVVKQLVVRRPRDTTERHDIAVAVSRFRLLEGDPQKYTSWKELYEHRADFVGLCVPGNKYGQYDRWLYVKAIDILANASEYYKMPENKQAQTKLVNSIREYFVGITYNPFRALYYKFMPMASVMDKIQNQK